MDKLFKDNGYSPKSQLLDCACGIGTQSIGLATLGYDVTASDISEMELEEAKRRACESGVSICFKKADFRTLSEIFSQNFDIVIALDNALPHMLTKNDPETAVRSIASRIRPGGMFVASIRDYDALFDVKPPYSAPYIHKTDSGQRVSFQTWDWYGENYKLTQYIIEDDTTLRINKFECEYRAVGRDELTNILLDSGFGNVVWKFTEETEFYQPIVIAKK